MVLNQILQLARGEVSIGWTVFASTVMAELRWWRVWFPQLHLSFSLSSGGEDGKKEKRETEVIPVQSLNLLLKSIGATLTDVQDVVFK